MHRNFHWYRNVLWFEEIPSHVGVVVGIAGADEVCNSASLFEYAKLWQAKRGSDPQKDLAQASPVAPIEVIYWPSYSHGQVLLSASAQLEITQKMLINEKNQKLN